MSTGEDTMPAHEGRSALRFLVVSAAAFGIDVVLALAGSRIFDVPIWLAATIAYGIVSSAFYFVHEHWTFARTASQNSARRMGQTIISSAISMVGRIGLIALLEAWREPGLIGAAGYIWLGAMVSLMINYALSRFWVFAPRRA